MLGALGGVAAAEEAPEMVTVVLPAGIGMGRGEGKGTRAFLSFTDAWKRPSSKILNTDAQ